MSSMTVTPLYMILLDNYYSCMYLKAGFHCCSWVEVELILYRTVTNDYFLHELIGLSNQYSKPQNY